MTTQTTVVSVQIANDRAAATVVRLRRTSTGCAYPSHTYSVTAPSLARLRAACAARMTAHDKRPFWAQPTLYTKE